MLNYLDKQASVVEGQPFSPQEHAHAEATLRATFDTRAVETMQIGFFYNLVMLIAAPLVMPSTYLLYPLIDAGFCAALSAFWFLRRGPRQLLDARHAIVFCNMLHMASATVVLRMIALGHDQPTMVLATSAIITIASILIILSPLANTWTVAMALGFWLLPILAVPAGGWLVMYSAALAFSCILRYGETVRLRRTAVLERRRGEAELRADSMSLQRELELAREIQDSMAPPPAQTSTGGVHIYCAQSKHDKVAGDWLAVRECIDRSIVVVVADATGKGMQAALVVHAIQSLWATTLAIPTFDATAWLECVNSALFRLGEKHPHSATMGVAVLNGQRLTYWSAGHLPLFLLLGRPGATAFKALLARGNPLGLSPTVQATPQYIDVAPNFPLRALIGSDGVFRRGTLTGKNEVESVYAQVRTHGGLAEQDGVIVDDDRTLVMLERDYEAKGVRTG